MRFTKQVVEGLSPPPGKPYGLFWDDALKGFGVKASAGGSRQYVAQYRTPDGRSPRITIGRVDTLSLDDARRQARTILARAQTGGDPQAEKAAVRKQVTVTLGTVTEAYLKHARGKLRPKSYEGVERYLTKDWKALHGMPLASIRRADVATQLNALREGRPVAATRSRTALSAMFTWAMGEGLAENNPVNGTNKPSEDKSRERVLTEAELRAIWHACGMDDHGAVVRLLMLTAQRRDEVSGMVESEIDEGAALWTLPGARVKNGRAHEVPLSPEALSILNDKPRLAGRSLIFGRGEGGFSGWSRSKERLDKRMAEAGAVVSPWTLHDLRRTAATMMADRLKVPPHVIEAILNHVSGSKASVAGIYNRATYRDEKRDALERWSSYISSL